MLYFDSSWLPVWKECLAQVHFQRERSQQLLMGRVWKPVTICIWKQHSWPLVCFLPITFLQCCHSRLPKHSTFVLKRNKITFKELFVAYPFCLAWCTIYVLHWLPQLLQDGSVHSAFTILKSWEFYLICDRFHVNFTIIWFLPFHGGSWSRNHVIEWARAAWHQKWTSM